MQGMINVNEWEWDIDKIDMLCINFDYNVSVSIEMIDGKPTGKLRDMPITMFGKIAEEKNGEDTIAQIIRTAEEAYLKQA